MIYKKKLINIKNFIFDVDGVFTDGSIIVDSEGNEMRVFNTKDGIAVKFATDIGYNICVISGGNNEGVRKRLSRLGVKDIFLGVDDKKEVFDNFLSKNNLSRSSNLILTLKKILLEFLNKVIEDEISFQFNIRFIGNRNFFFHVSLLFEQILKYFSFISFMSVNE